MRPGGPGIPGSPFGPCTVLLLLLAFCSENRICFQTNLRGSSKEREEEEEGEEEQEQGVKE